VTRYRIELQGRADHADGTSMAERCYALAGAAQVISAVERLWMDGAGVGTVGRLTVSPNSINVVPETVAMWTDMRSLDSAPLDPSHAANQMAKIAPIGMLFATSRDGRSHCPEKWTEELAPGLRP
jgi:acetylornithine deacetylase/succinyl-diaminopimelate desuccinylase-like protein